MRSANRNPDVDHLSEGCQFRLIGTADDTPLGHWHLATSNWGHGASGGPLSKPIMNLSS